ncbi:type I restriction-modification system subunit M [Metamycoplasma hyosynoviae]|uniref:type I restriction-modification system subunit M n=1 Tax=Metamycoplasma hyosynoviae TaxID=29559 RepID=UPI0023595D59|nr:class I SAM-dependent DNA methyltransferase [Metamycoplasma hyosynoviae]MDC8901102.1 class I SAM-dependent DNA methyltransferase [Metamycoplasma hyosynoviae]MDC8913392.1 class I SAM-dependent DNA methyltransferase [Metamycoplasma hyosynoviae]MDC8914405.1 class I SAM-dependent DNA methyltransferase [Metamycoplasma hyosynoviae]MDC8915427.1 class I SAM-dependent DNA methyltransferase [Metamycoplasma hyosynoviae]MDC8918628.1 class I SAM-dependent DNA methyltransferase [Metamycoplasma hyosynovia
MSQIIDENILWKAAEKLRDKVDPADYKNVVLGLVFLKYVSDKYIAKYNELKKNGDGSEKEDDYYIADHVFIVPKNSLWSYVASHSKQVDLGQVIDNAFIELEKNNNQLKGILPKTYSKSDLDKNALGELVDFFTNHLNMEDADGDFFGQVYEYYVGEFAKHIATKGGEFFTPKSLVELMVDILEPYKGRVYDPCCGSGGMFVQCSKFVKKHQGLIDNISIYGQESNPGTWKMAKMNLAIRGLEGNLGDRNADSFTDDLHKNLKADYIIANPPYNLKEYWKPSLDGDPRWVEFGKPDEKNANYAWISLMYSKLSHNGKAAILMPNGATTSNTKDDYKIRKAMIEAGKIDAILALPNKLFSNVSISVQCWVLNKEKTNTDILFINADSMGKLLNRKIRVLEEADINKIVKAYKDFKSNTLEDIPGFCKKASLEEIKSNDYSLNPGRYVGADESNKLSPKEIQDELRKASAELFELIKEGKELEEKVKEILEKEMK